VPELFFSEFEKCTVFVIKSMNFLDAIRNKKTLLRYVTHGAYGTYRACEAHGTSGTN